MRDERRQRGLHLRAPHDEVDHAVREQEFRALKPFGELLTDGRSDDARPGESDERAGLGHVHVAEQRQARGHAARRGIAKHADERKPRRTKALERGDHLCHLHERKDPLLHARAARSLKQHDRQPRRHRPLEEPRDLLADDRSHTAAHELEVVRAVRHGPPVDGPSSRFDRFDGLGGLLCRGDAVPVALAVGEPQRVGRAQMIVPRVERAVVEQELAPTLDAEAVVVAARRADFEAIDEALRRVGFAATVALAKDAFSKRLFALRLGGILRRPSHDDEECSLAFCALPSALQLFLNARPPAAASSRARTRRRSRISSRLGGGATGPGRFR